MMSSCFSLISSFPLPFPSLFPLPFPSLFSLPFREGFGGRLPSFSPFP